MQQLHASFNATNMTLEYNIVNDDFVIRAASSDRTGKFDVVICNPPYFKVNAKSIHATATKNIVQGQCNMYTLFMSLSALLLKEDGLLLFLVPRSFTSGKYFEKFRKEFFGHMSLDAVHLFQSRSDAFKKDNVLQENIILLCRKNQHQSAEIQLSVCEGASDIGSRIIRRVASDIVLCSANIVRLPCTEQEDQTLQQVDEWECSLSKLGFAVSTGPIVAFRAQSHIIENKEKGKYPLLWMHHVKPMAIEWPIVSLKKPQYLTATAPENLLVSCKNMVLLRRFSAKEQERRVIACPLIASDLSSSLEKLGIENHLNYITGVDTEMTDEQTFGLAALLSSDIVDRYVRISSGNTQISATELGLLPLPDMNILERIGRKLIDVSDRSLSVVNQIIVETLATKKKRLVAIEHADGPQRKKTK
jgi:adenine-specific DNA-methyltransferase